MTNSDLPISFSLIKALPESFTFYDLGEVKTLDATPEVEALWDQKTAIAFRLLGDQFESDFEGWMFLFFDANLGQAFGDESIYTEIGNIFASRIAGEICATLQIQGAPSHPLRLKSQQIEAVQSSTDVLLKKTYGHFYKDHVVPLTLLILSRSPEEFGHA